MTLPPSPHTPNQHAAQGLALLGGALDGGAGAQLVLSVMMACSGDMPPDYVSLLAVALHQIWTCVGNQRWGLQGSHSRAGQGKAFRARQS